MFGALACALVEKGQLGVGCEGVKFADESLGLVAFFLEVLEHFVWLCVGGLRCFLE
jgi:hypothetical protein